MLHASVIRLKENKIIYPTVLYSIIFKFIIEILFNTRAVLLLFQEIEVEIRGKLKIKSSQEVLAMKDLRTDVILNFNN